MTTCVSARLADRRPHVLASSLLSEFVPPPHFAGARFDTYIANPAFPSQAEVLGRLRQVADEIAAPRRSGLTKILRRRSSVPAVYLDGGFGVGKTHLLVSLAHAVGTERCAYGTFVEYTNLVGALGFRATVETLAQCTLVCIDEFELDDPGDTVLMSRLLRELGDRGVALAATSNTLPESLGEGRFAAEDFLREIQALSARFEVLRIDGEDFRHRAARTEGLVRDEAAVAAHADRLVAKAEGKVTVTEDEFSALMAHLATIHPSQYGAMLDGVDIVVLHSVTQIVDQHSALRFVVLVDRLYDRDIPVLLAGDPATEIFPEAMLRGGYRKKYYRTLSRLGALVD